MPTPLISVVIPTHGRPQYLPRAVDSALAHAGPDVEVIIVPNGEDASWKASLAPFERDSRVNVSPIAVAHGNVARNRGLAVARGKYVRFLDDDDYLSGGATDQLALLEHANAEFASGLVMNKDKDGVDLGQLRTPPTSDFVCAAVQSSGFTLPVGNVFLRSSLQSIQWDPTVSRLQDNAWMIDLAIHREWRWQHLEQVVGVWFQHDAPRTSTTRPHMMLDRPITDRLIRLHEVLAGSGRLTQDRAQAIAGALWGLAHGRFPYAPSHWSAIAREAQRIGPRSRPHQIPYELPLVRLIDPVLIEWVLTPPRLFSRWTNRRIQSLFGNDYRRQL